MKKLKIFTSLNLSKSFWFFDLERTENINKRIKMFSVFQRNLGENFA